MLMCWQKSSSDKQVVLTTLNVHARILHIIACVDAPDAKRPSASDRSRPGQPDNSETLMHVSEVLGSSHPCASGRFALAMGAATAVCQLDMGRSPLIRM